MELIHVRSRGEGGGVVVIEIGAVSKKKVLEIVYVFYSEYLGEITNFYSLNSFEICRQE